MSIYLKGFFLIYDLQTVDDFIYRCNAYIGSENEYTKNVNNYNLHVNKIRFLIILASLFFIFVYFVWLLKTRHISRYC